MRPELSKVFTLNNYRVLDYLMQHVELEIDLSKRPVQCRASLLMVPNPILSNREPHLELNGENMILTALTVDGRLLTIDEYELTTNSLIIKNVPQTKSFTVKATTRLGENTDLFGLYETEGTILIKAETEGLRRVFYCHDRPDNLATYTTTIIAHEESYPILLANGRLIEKKKLTDGLFSVTWLDTLPKPSYLFALVAGKLAFSAVNFVTKSGRELPIEFYVAADATAKCDFAKQVIQHAMAWEERVYQLECDLPQHMVAGVDKYASGASEPTGLNLFNTENLYATQQTRTDEGILRVLEVVAHEFFHYWTGDRVTIRDWFNLPLKEGLTTFRTAMFREELFGTTIVRLLDGKNLDERAPRQHTYTAVRSLYTPAAYEKSADIFRMIMLCVGQELFYPAMTHFLRDNDGKAVTLEDVIHSLSQSLDRDLRTFLPWFTEDGIPELTVTDEYSPAAQRYTLQIKTSGRKNRPIPLALGLLNSNGQEVLATTLLTITQDDMIFQFDNISSAPVPSLLRDFSAPVILRYPHTVDNLLLLMQYDTNLYNRCEAAKQLIITLVQQKPIDLVKLSSSIINTYRNILQDKSIDPWILAELLTLPREEELLTQVTSIHFEQIIKTKNFIHQQLAHELKNEWSALLHHLTHFEAKKPEPSVLFDIDQAGRRRLKAVCYSYWQFIDRQATQSALESQFAKSLGNNMTDTVSALSLLCNITPEETGNTLLNKFYEQWKGDTHAINYWFKVQAACHFHCIKRMRHLLIHEAFDLLNPNKVYALIGPFLDNIYGFHAISGEGYRLVAEVILSLDKINPPLAANLTQRFVCWEKYDEKRQQMMLANLTFIHAEAVSVDVKNRAQKGLDKALATAG